MKTHKTLWCIFACLLIGLLMPVMAWSADDIAAKTAYNALKRIAPDVQLYHQDNHIARIYGQAFAHGSSAINSAEQLRLNYAPLLGISAEDLRPVSVFNDKLSTQQVMFDQETNRYKFTLVYYSQYKNDIPVFRGEIRVLVLNQADYPAVMASCDIKDLGDFDPSPATASSINLEQVQKTFLSNYPELVNYTQPRLVIWAGHDSKTTLPQLGVEFTADNGTPATQKFLFIIDPQTNAVIYKENKLIDVNVTGQINGLATENYLAEQCGNEVTTALPYAWARISGADSAYADATGQFTITNSGSSAVTVISQIKGRYFYVTNQAGSNSQLSQSVTPPGPATFLFNPSNTEYTRAEVNGYLHANVVRDYALTYNPTYPTVYTQTNFPVYVNDNDSYYCPGNAWYDGVSLTFCRAGGSYPNTAFASVIHHEYGHHLVEMAGSGQDEYGEGMGDVMGVLISDTPQLGLGFTGNCSQALRTADNNYQYPCTGEIHECGQLLSGCVWSTRNELAATYPSTYRSIISNLAINAMLLRTANDGSITPTITIDYLTLDDTDGNIYNGTPHYPEICAGFGAHNMDCPALQTGVFITHTPLGNTPSNSAYQVDAVITSTEASIDTTIIYWSNGGAYSPVLMTNIGGSNYRGYIPGQSSCTTVSYRIYATDALHNTKYSPESGYHSFYVGTFDTIFVDNVEGGTNGWTHSAVTSGYTDQWAIRNHRNHTTGGTYSWKCGSSSSTGTYSSLSDGGLVTPEITLTSQATLTFWMWAEIENSTTTAAWDGAIVEISVNGGAFTRITPVDGYPYTTIGGYSHPWTAGTPCWSGDYAWTQMQFDLNAYSGNSVRVRFRFGTDSSVNYEGWYIDDIIVTAAVCDSTPSGTITGTVSDSRGTLNAVIVTANDGAGHTGVDTTASNGIYSIIVPEGNYGLSFHQIDHRDTSLTGIIVVGDSTTTVNMTMQRLPGSISGTVTNGGSAIANVIVSINDFGLIDTTNSVGAFGFTNLADTTYSLSFSHPAYLDTTVSGILVTPGDATTRDVVMKKRNGWLEGIISDTSGALLQNVYVKINNATLLRGIHGFNDIDRQLSSENQKDSDGSMLLAVDSMYTNSSGYFISYIPWGNYNVSFTKAGFVDTTLSGLTVAYSDTTTLALTMRTINYAPVITSQAIDTATEHAPFLYVATATDANGTTPSLSFSLYPAWLNVSGDTIAGTPPEGASSTSFRIIASDGEKADTQIVSLIVIAVNDRPQITSPDSATATEHILFSYTATAVDPEGVTPAIGFRNYPGWLQVSGTTISGYPPQNPHDTSFAVIAFDGSLADTQLVTLRVIAVNDPPTITSLGIDTATINLEYLYTATATDPDNLVLDVNFDNYAGWLSVTGNTIHGIPPFGSNDTTFRIIVSDGELADSLVVGLIVKSGCVYLPGDINSDSSVLGGDVTFAVRFFKGLGNQPPDSCYLDSTGSYLYVAGDINGNCEFRGSDVTRLVAYFKGTAEMSYCHFFAPPPLIKIVRNQTPVNSLQR
jgi:hypothetical protein